MDLEVAAKTARNPGQPDEVQQSLYAKREKVYPREVHGLFAAMRVAAVFILLGLFYGLPWLHWDGQQILLFDLPARQFHIFGLTIFPQDFVYLTLLLIIAALSLFFFTAIGGRLWCGYACPQTVWTEVFMWIDRKIEGDRPKQMKLDKAPWTAHKFAVKGSKHLIWILFSAFTGFTFVGYFTPILELGQKLLAFNLGAWETFWILFYGLATYGNAGWLREQVCIYMCPYARFQSAMFDRDTLIISYDRDRGEPRGARKRKLDHRAAGLGDCIDCTLCVQVCPTGIDIRNGLQFQCIACAACIDACDDVMAKMGYPKGLVRYTTQNAVSGRPTRVFRPRIAVYAFLLVGITGAVVFGLTHRVPLDLDVIRDRNALYRETSDGMVENVYTLKVINMDNRSHRYHLSVAGILGMELLGAEQAVAVNSGEVVSLPVRVRVDPFALDRRSTAITFTLEAESAPRLRTVEEARFLGPVPRG
jgi:cytochrome c oxidase accessory protein FixG